MYKHGVYVTESATKITTPVYSDAAVQVAVGLAPVHLLDDPQSAVNVPIKVNSFEEAVTKIGYCDNFKFTLNEVIDASFRVFNIAPIVVINVLDPKKHTTTKEEQQISVKDKSAVLADDGVLLKTIAVKSADGTKSLVLNTDYVVSFNDSGKAVIQLVSTGSAAEETALKVNYAFLDTEKVTENDIIGGYNAATGQYSGLEAVRKIYPKHGIVPGLLLCPGYSQNPNVYAAMTAKSEKVNGCFNLMNFADVDTKVVKLYENAYEWKNQNGYNSKFTVLCFPKAAIGNKQYHMSTLAAALEAYTVSQSRNIPYVSPSNKLFRITGTVLEDGTEVDLDQEQANQLNAQGIFTAININGWRSWGNETACYPANTDIKDRFIACRSMFNWWSNTFILTYFQAVDNPANLRLINRLVDTENIRANGFISNEEIAGARISYIAGNTNSLLEATTGFKQYLAFYTPAKDIENDLEFDISLLKSAINGGIA